jgi:hypothetical protein
MTEDSLDKMGTGPVIKWSNHFWMPFGLNGSTPLDNQSRNQMAMAV